MFFLIRAAFWLSIVIVLLPTPESAKIPESNIGAAQAISAASATVADMRQFCERQPGACEVGSAALTHFGHKAQASAKWVYEWLTDKGGTDQNTAKREIKSTAVEAESSQNTLTASDTAPMWRGPQRQAEAKR
jgi:hypothetical protein